MQTDFIVKLAETETEFLAAQRLRYRVFVEELGGDGELVDHGNRFERDKFDPFFDHLILIDPQRDGDPLEAVVGVYRVLRDDQAQRMGQFYSEDEYDLSVLKSSGRRLLELGRSCVDADFRGGTAMYHMWSGLAEYVAEHRIEVLFGVASFHGTDVQALRQPLSFLHHRHLAPPDLRARTRSEFFQSMDLLPEDQLDRRAASLQIPSLIKGYLRLGGFVGEGAFIDHAFNTVDVCLIMDTERLSRKHSRIYAKGQAHD